MLNIKTIEPGVNGKEISQLWKKGTVVQQIFVFSNFEQPSTIIQINHDLAF